MANKVTAEEARKLVQNSMDLLAPKFKQVVTDSRMECLSKNLPIEVYETVRTDQLQRMYYELKVSRARNAFWGWHFYGLAVDIIHPSHGWDWWPSWDAKAGLYVGGNPDWWKPVVQIFKSHNMDWGGDWNSIKDCPHFQWGPCRASPSERSIELYHAGGVKRVWDAVGAM